MPLDEDIGNVIESAIKNDLAAPRITKKRVPKLKRVWRCEHAFDFLYGHRAGYYTGLAEGLVLERYKRHLTADEDNKVFEIIDLYADNMRKYFAYYKQKRMARRTPSHKQ